ncbi:MAG: sialate O-acetylesterase [Akkermansiaceae bacterium]|nr:sialate O-acetylesterase [Akkermansiaceae bacterium]
MTKNLLRNPLRRISRTLCRNLCLLAGLAASSQIMAEAKPLKVYILAGQSNMQGQAKVETIERLQYEGGDLEMYKAMTGDDGKPDAPEGVYGVYFSNGDIRKGEPRPLLEKAGPLLPGFAEDPGPKERFGPAYTFGIYMHKHLNEPILIIKTAWGGRNLMQQFRPPSAGPYEQDKDGHGNPTGAYYQHMVKHVKDVLADPGKYHPGYDADQGAELAGFVWFQGFNDMIGPYPEKDFSEYTRLMATLIKDLRKDLNAPNLPTVIGVMGIGGPIEDESDKQFHFRKAQAATGSLPEFQDNVTIVQTAPLWDMELERIMNKLNKAAEEKAIADKPDLADKPRALRGAIKDWSKKIASKVLTEEELKVYETGKSNQAFHYMGSALTYGRIGRAFADAMHELSTKD